MIALLVIIILFVFFLALLGIRIVRPYQRACVERLGRYQRTVQPGLNFILPFLERLLKVDMREQVVDVPPQEVITQDNATVTVDAVIYYEVTDPVRVLYNVAQFRLATIKLAQTNLRNVVGDLSLDESLTSRERINVKLRDVLDEATDKWGAKVTRVELQRIEPPGDVTEAMHRQMKAERERRAAVLEAEGFKQAQILRADGERQKRVLEATGQAEAIERVATAEKFKLLTVAEGEAQAIERVYAAIHNGRPTNDLIAIKYLEALAKIADGKASKLFVPYEASGVLGAVGMVGELLKDKAAGTVTVPPPAKG
ncbi:MAG TPA: SPFH/Band 7/PHB domain protein [candidate division WOR-3 bacterium]|uniref:SPFH/Band 7/PHB domain protein n=1 Tax=candidate division WOR-3 bacterium TaxID=2052148 RepID=A0A7V0T4U8_UNCW3|nr:SPFH/Band 7/PHB domain protein [candidate division WOR-3 bacterium]